MQTPKEKAIQLVKAFYVETTTSTEAKQCAKLHISLILEENEIIKPSNNIEYYQEVFKRNRKIMKQKKVKTEFIWFLIGWLSMYLLGKILGCY